MTTNVKGGGWFPLTAKYLLSRSGIVCRYRKMTVVPKATISVLRQVKIRNLWMGGEERWLGHEATPRDACGNQGNDQPDPIGFTLCPKPDIATQANASRVSITFCSVRFIKSPWLIGASSYITFFLYNPRWVCLMFLRAKVIAGWQQSGVGLWISG